MRWKAMRPNTKYLLLFVPIMVLGFSVAMTAVTYVHDDVKYVNIVLGIVIVACGGVSYLLGQLSIINEVRRRAKLAVINPDELTPDWWYANRGD